MGFHVGLGYGRLVGLYTRDHAETGLGIPLGSWSEGHFKGGAIGNTLPSKGIRAKTGAYFVILETGVLNSLCLWKLRPASKG